MLAVKFGQELPHLLGGRRARRWQCGHVAHDCTERMKGLSRRERHAADAVGEERCKNEAGCVP